MDTTEYRPSRVEWAYLAGIIDGEGSIGVYPHARGLQRQICVVNTDEALIDWIAERFDPTSVTWRPGTALQGLAVKPVAMLQWCSKARQERIVKGTLPFLVVKREKALALLESIRVAPGSGSPGVRRVQVCKRGHDVSDLPAGGVCKECRAVWNKAAYARRRAATAKA